MAGCSLKTREHLVVNNGIIIWAYISPFGADSFIDKVMWSIPMLVVLAAVGCDLAPTPFFFFNWGCDDDDYYDIFSWFCEDDDTSTEETTTAISSTGGASSTAAASSGASEPTSTTKT